MEVVDSSSTTPTSLHLGSAEISPRQAMGAAERTRRGRLPRRNRHSRWSRAKTSVPRKIETMSNFHYVCLLTDVATETHFYTGVTEDLESRLQKHNAGEVPPYVQIQTVTHKNSCRI